MTSQRWSTLVSVLVFALVLATAGSARAQWVIPGTSGYPPVSQFGLGFGAVQGISPFDFGSLGVASFGGLGGVRGFPHPGYGRSIGRTPQAITSFQSVSDVVTLVPGWNGSAHRISRRH